MRTLKARKAAWTPVTHMDHSSCLTTVRPPENRHSSKALLNQRELWENYLKWKVCYANVLRDCREKCQEGRVYGCGGEIVRLSSQFIVSALVHLGSACLLLARGGGGAVWSVPLLTLSRLFFPSSFFAIPDFDVARLVMPYFSWLFNPNGKYNVTKFLLLPKCLYLTFYVALKGGRTIWRWHWLCNSP